MFNRIGFIHGVSTNLVVMRFPGFVYALFVFSVKAGGLNLERPVVVGASLSDGFHLQEMGIPFVSPISEQLGLHHHLDEALQLDHGRFRNLGSKWFFLAPEPHGANQISKARKMDPTVVIAVDFLFWYLSAEQKHRGRGFRNLSRLEYLELGLAHLAKLECPLVVGNIPDAATSVGRVLSPAQHAGAETIAKANKRIREWAASRANVGLLDLHKFHQQASRNLEVEMVGKSIPAGKSRELFLQWDQIHPTLEGVRAVASEIVPLLGDLP